MEKEKENTVNAMNGFYIKISMICLFMWDCKIRLKTYKSDWKNSFIFILFIISCVTFTSQDSDNVLIPNNF
jgi:hypothetical protein